MTTNQAPLHSGYGALTTATEAMRGVALTNVIAVVTGGHQGVGLETTKALAAAGATVIVGARSPDKARALVAGIPRAEVATIDLSEPASIDAFAAQFLASDRALHILVNNAGIMAVPFTRDRRGYESQLATNHLGHFQLTARLWPALRRAGNARVISVSSRGHARGGVDFGDPQFERRPYDKYLAYAQSKTANALFAVALDAFGSAYGVRAFSVHPGAVMTQTVRDMVSAMSAEELQAATAQVGALSAFKTPEQGAATSVWCATTEQLDGMGGVYCEDVDIAETVEADDPGVADRSRPGVRPWAMAPSLAERLWTMSEEWTETRFNA